MNGTRATNRFTVRSCIPCVLKIILAKYNSNVIIPIMEIRVFPVVAKELKKEPQELKESIYGVFERLERGENIPLPLCRPLFSLLKGLYELRFSYRAGEYRVFYYVKIGDAIYIIHAMKKKTQKLETRVIELLKKRIRSLP